MGVTLSQASIPKLRQAIADGEAFRLSRGGDRLPDGPAGVPFYALVTGSGFETPVNKNASTSDLRQVYSFVRLAPCADEVADLWVNNSQGYRILPDAIAHIHEAIEINGRPTPSNEIVQMTFVGFVESSEMLDGKQVNVKRPRFAFNYAPTLFEPFLPIHDHRDNFNGGFAFACFHPGTSLPQMPWAR